MAFSKCRASRTLRSSAVALEVTRSAAVLSALARLVRPGPAQSTTVTVTWSVVVEDEEPPVDEEVSSWCVSR